MFWPRLALFVTLPGNLANFNLFNLQILVHGMPLNHLDSVLLKSLCGEVTRNAKIADMPLLYQPTMYNFRTWQMHYLNFWHAFESFRFCPVKITIW